MLATEYLWMSTCECITVGGLLLTCVPTFRSDLEITALPHTDTNFSLFNTIDSKATLFLKPHFAQSFHCSSIVIAHALINFIHLRNKTGQ